MKLGSLIYHCVFDSELVAIPTYRRQPEARSVTHERERGEKKHRSEE